ncbi:MULTISPECIES: cytochrome d ubiquinol oxidase subunit II [Pseudofrankia]|uniref:cytochrome d ubiquinol oxidase subunit II n=1 Tax=Pseudofrankia TaxID=2994363 RepID=UPI000234D3F9|nr:MULTISPECIES: cytochrome d ubiquinol oxidase subunit II [Pseudofrankia]OHV32454.1 cytochrome d ubiquinol oxidase subunit II [Pseudofrankia sp. EUN1h]
MLPDFWFALVAVLWTGFFVLEGFDFGVAALLPFLGRNRPAPDPARAADADSDRGHSPAATAPAERDRRAVLGTIGPVWDGNEVWLLTAGGAMFAAFPEWYASVFSGFYLALFLVLAALIVRGVALEYRGKAATDAGRAWCDRGIVLGGLLPPLLFGVAFANIVRGVKMTPDHEVTSNLLDLLNPYGLLGGVTVLLLCLLHGAVFVTLKTAGDVRERARAAASALFAPTAAALFAYLTWTVALRGDVAVDVVAAAAFAALLSAVGAHRAGRDGWAFAATAATLAGLVATWFVAIAPEVLPKLGGGPGLTIHEAASSPYTLKLMTVVALVATPVVLAYQAWSYWVFRRRLFGADGPTGHARESQPAAPDQEPTTTTTSS